MKLKNLILGLFASIAVLASCQQAEEQLGAPVLNLEPGTMEFDSQKGEQVLKITATRDWAVTVDKEVKQWLVFDPASGAGSNKVQEVKVSVMANAEHNRSYDALFSIGMITKNLTVSQKGDKGEPVLEITKISDFIKAADEQKICVLKGRISGVRHKNSEGKGFFGFDIADETGKVTAAFPANWDEWKDQLKNGQIVTLKGAYQFYADRGTHQVKDATILKIEEGGDVPPAEAEHLSIADFIGKADTQKIYQLSGIISGVKHKNSEGKGFFGFDIADETGKVTAAFPANWDEWKDKLKNGQKVTLQGAYQFYADKGTHQVKDAIIIKIEEGVPPTDVEQISVADFISKADNIKIYQLTGNISGVKQKKPDGKGFFGFDLNDGTGTVTAAFPANWDEWKDQLKDGQKVTLQGSYQFYADKGTHQVKDAVIIKIEEGGSTPDQPTGEAIFTETFESSLGNFTVVDVTKPAALTNGVWQFSEKFKCAVATGYTGGEGGSRLTTESSLVSPEIDLTSEKEVYLEFEQAGNYFKDGKAATSLVVVKDGKETALAMDNTSLSGFVFKKFDIDLTPYVGGKIQIKLTYKSTPENCGTWEIKNFNVFKGKYVAPVLPDEPAVPEGTKVVLKTNESDMSFTPETDPVYGKGFSATKDGVKIGYYQHNSTSAIKEPYSDHIRLYKSSAFVISIDNAKIKYIKFVTPGGKYVAAYTTKEGKVEVIGDNVFWTGETASPFVGEMTIAQIRVKEMIIVY